jgi:hypothetical protein
MWLAELLAHGLIRASFVPDAQTQEMRNLLRTRKQLVREQSSHVLRVQKTLEDANIKCLGASAWEQVSARRTIGGKAATAINASHGAAGAPWSVFADGADTD